MNIDIDFVGGYLKIDKVGCFGIGRYKLVVPHLYSLVKVRMLYVSLVYKKELCRAWVL